ncbi:CinA family nicotinamide mononucleotide deamidase-related protein [Oceanimonas baumannii]|uniref:Molybdenum cofactor synthesis domain-containing protein/competence/damage-inducible protein CinA-like protein n=1 Tax=Oceanimonas baumannii TaxID=129578 RepID=A0A235CJ34_9GAMM|nr:CinA family nicotinamide mononucleotide deamidase-related protein [Oceanimonas baumannii]OYD24543.1 molybdopterin-binding protein [Oceanimonas baumannii]TDW59276.1 molybdenum cofactor synthesis domain-containing protein/competence/damage-inducible protein CinA-like protein [Oceanimonas baumannii]
MDPVIELISTGDEVLTGLITDTNAGWLSQRLLEQGWQVRRRFTVGDNKADLVALFEQRSHCADIVIVNGGLGPTSDDISAAAMAETAAVPLVLNEWWLKVMREKYAGRSRTMPESNIKQAMLPEGAEVVDNPIGTACGFSVQYNRSLFFFTPGVPSELKKMMDQEILPRMRNRLGQQGKSQVRRYFLFGLSESGLSDQLDSLSWPAGIILGYRANAPTIELKLIIDTDDADAIAVAEAQLLKEVGNHLVARDELQFAALSSLLHDRDLVIFEDASGGRLTDTLHTLTPEFEGHYLAGLPDTAEDLAQWLKGSGRATTLAIGAEGPQGVPMALLTPNGCQAQTLKVHFRDPLMRRRLLAFAAFDMLRRQLEGLPVIIDYDILPRSEQISLP